MPLALFPWLLGVPMGSLALDIERKTNDEINRLIDDLDSPRYAAREEAGRRLVELGEPALAPLKRALAENRSLEFRLRAAKVADKLRLYEPGGEVVGGLKLRLTVSRASLRPKERISLTSMVANMSRAPLRIELGPAPIGTSWECGAKLQRLDGGKTIDASWVVGFNAPRTTYHTLGPKSFWEFETPVTLLTRIVLAPPLGDGKGDTFLSLGSKGYTTLDAPFPGEIALRLQHQAVADRSDAAKAPLWTGTVHSNIVLIKLAP